MDGNASTNGDAAADGLEAGRPQALILTGAGASADAGVPTAFPLTDKIGQALDGAHLAQAANVYRYVVGGIMMAKGQSGNGPFEGVNVEEVFSAVELLAERGSLEAAPFIGSWHPGVEALDRTNVRYDNLARTIVAQVAEAAKRGRVSFASPTFNQAFERAIRETISGGNGAVYANAADRMLESLKKLLQVHDPEKVEYLQPLLAYAQHHGAVIATLNYDASVEATAEAMGVPCSTGIAEWDRGDGFRWSSDEVPLLKLHGSIGWEWKDDPIEAGGGERERTLHEHHWSEAARTKPVLVFGQRDKLRVEGPFLDLLMQFRQALRAATCLLTIGYSFRDPHVNHYIEEWLDKGSRKHVVVLDKKFRAESRLALRLASLGARWITRIDRTTAEGLSDALAALDGSLSSVHDDPTREPGYRIRQLPSDSLPL